MWVKLWGLVSLRRRRELFVLTQGGQPVVNPGVTLSTCRRTTSWWDTRTSFPVYRPRWNAKRNSKSTLPVNVTSVGDKTLETYKSPMFRVPTDPPSPTPSQVNRLLLGLRLSSTKGFCVGQHPPVPGSGRQVESQCGTTVQQWACRPSKSTHHPLSGRWCRCLPNCSPNILNVVHSSCGPYQGFRRGGPVSPRVPKCPDDPTR